MGKVIASIHGKRDESRQLLQPAAGRAEARRAIEISSCEGNGPSGSRNRNRRNDTVKIHPRGFSECVRPAADWVIVDRNERRDGANQHFYDGHVQGQMHAGNEVNAYADLPRGGEYPRSNAGLLAINSRQQGRGHRRDRQTDAHPIMTVCHHRPP
jgi:hypothetical protein